MDNPISRGEALKTMATGAAALAMASLPGGSLLAQSDKSLAMPLKGNINHSVCRWCYKDISLEDLCSSAKEMGLKSVELLNPDEYHVPIKHGLTCAISFGGSLGIVNGFNDPKNHEQLLKELTEIIPKAADAGIKNVICFSGNRRDMSDEDGLENCAVGLDPVVKVAQKYKVNMVMELLNSKVNHPDYMCDLTPWGVKLVEKVGSENFGLLYDIYHMQIMEGDVIATIRKYHQYFMHYHTGGVPGRHEIDETQELYYPAIMRAILETGYTGFVGQEFVPANEDQLASLKTGVWICDV